MQGFYCSVLLLCPISPLYCHLQHPPHRLCVHVKRTGLPIVSDRLVVIQLEEEPVSDRLL